MEENKTLENLQETIVSEKEQHDDVEVTELQPVVELDDSEGGSGVLLGVAIGAAAVLAVEGGIKAVKWGKGKWDAWRNRKMEDEEFDEDEFGDDVVAEAEAIVKEEKSKESKK